MQINFFYNSYLFSKLINYFMKHGKKEKIERDIDKVFLILSRETKLPLINYILNLVEIYKPFIGIRYVIKKKLLLPVPTTLSISRKYHLALRWIKEGVDGKPRKRTAKLELKHTRRLAKKLEKKMRQTKSSQDKLLDSEVDLIHGEGRYKVTGYRKTRFSFKDRLEEYITDATEDPYSTYS